MADSNGQNEAPPAGGPAQVAVPMPSEEDTSVQFPTQDGQSPFQSTSQPHATYEDLDQPLTISPPEEAGDLPDIQKLLASLEENEQQLENARQPPSLFERPETLPYFKDITQKKQEVETEEDIENYLDDFLKGVRDDVLMIGQISLEEVQDEEKRLRDEHISYLEQQKRLEALIKAKLLILEEEAKKRIAWYLKEKRRLIQRSEQLQLQRERIMLDRMNKAFRKSENQLVAVLEKRKAEVKRYYGDLMQSQGHYGGSKGRRWKVDWEETPQPIQIKLNCLRGLKDKIPGGRYVMMVSLYNRLGGHILRWSKLKGQHWAGATLPVSHDGHFYNIEMKVDQSVFTVLPSKNSVRPGMCLVFELFLLRGDVVSTDRVVGWGTFPISDAEFNIVEGKFKAPMLRGEMDLMIDKYEKVEKLLSTELDHWLCNTYFEIVCLPRYLAGQNEYEVELQFSSGLIAFPDRIDVGDEDALDGEGPIPGSLDEIKSIGASNVNMSRTTMDTEKVLGSDSSLQGSSNASDKKLPIDVTDKEKRQMAATEEKASNLRKRRPQSVISSRVANKDKKVEFSDSDSELDETDIYVKHDDDFYAVKGHAGMWYKRHENNPVDNYHRKIYNLLPKTPLLKERLKRKKLTHVEQLEQHSFAVMRRDMNKGRMEKPAGKKMQYIRRQMLAEMGLSEWRSREFWGMLFMFVMVFFVRIYMHYIVQWVLIQALEVPVNKFDFLPYTVNLNYQNTLMGAREEAMVVLLGPFGNVFLFVVMVILSWLLQKIMGGVPDIVSKFFFAYGLQAFLDPFLIAIVDSILKRYRNLGDDPIADFAKMYWYFYRLEGSGLWGIVITIFIYMFTCFAAASILYMYFLRLHNNGRMLDVYWRLHGFEEIFFVPYDLEMSNQELSYISRKAEQWRGEEGERRKVAVYDYIWEEEEVDDEIWDENASVASKQSNKDKDKFKREITTHISVHTIHLDGLRELYRHFLRLADGAIIEIFGDMTMAGMNKDLTKALNQGTSTLEDLPDPNKVTRPQSAAQFKGLKG